ncbi:AGAP011176-PA-like protein [Anopheles sinensis]|uniref:AGAP011176-PA-like protein n=1 Tax=Anopheles sinensis TaxID=74873 RepID=A0A084VHV5_ANOSI|nr:AGAP011176-PA-like protein [Anopheles sinensis]
MLACLGLGSFIMGVCIFCKKKSGKFKKFKDGDIIQEVISTEYPILKALNVLDSSVPCAVIPSSPNNLSTDNLLDKIETYQIDVDHRHDSYCTRRSDPLTCTYDEFDPNDESDDRTERTATTATVEPPISEEPLLFSDVFDESMERSEKCALTTIPMQLPTSSGEEDDEALVAPRSDAEDEDERRPLVSDESIDEAAATTATTITVTATMAQSADAISIDLSPGEEDEEDDDDDDDEEEGQATPLNVESEGSSGSPSIYSEPPADNALTREDVEQQAAELVDDVLYKCQYMLQMMDANGSNLSPLEAEEFSPTNSRGNIFDGWGNYELDDNGSFTAVGEENDNDDWWKGSLEPFDDDEGSWNRAGNDPFENDQAYDLLRQQLSQLLPQANDCASGAIRLNTDDQAQGSPKLADNGGLGGGFERADRETEENEIIINYNRSLSPIMEENEDECSLPPSISVAHCSNFVESTIISTEGPVVCEATESVPALAKRSSLTASNDTLFNLEDVLEDRCMTPQDSDTFPAGNSASPRTLLSESNNQGLEKLYTTFSASRLMPLASVTVTTTATPPLPPPPPASIVSPLAIGCPSPSPPPLPTAIVGLNGGAGGSGTGTTSGLLMGETMQDLPSSA